MTAIAPYTIEYPETDGLPMGETDTHIEWIIRLRLLLRRRYRGQRVYVASNLFLYYSEGHPTTNIVPDGFVVLDCEPRRRRTFKIWEEKRVPNVAFEVTSRGTSYQDMRIKPKQYEQIGVRELFLYDPTAEYLDPSLIGFRLGSDGYRTIEPDDTGALESRELGVNLRLEGRRLALYDRQTGEPLLTEAEAKSAALKTKRAALKAERAALKAERSARKAKSEALEAEKAAHEAERAAREAAERRAEEEASARRAAEEEVRRLRDQLKRKKPKK